MAARRMLVAAIVIGAACAAPGSAAAAVRPGVYKLSVPAPGHVTVAALDVTVLRHGRGAPPARLAISVPKRTSLSSQVRFFFARRRVLAGRSLRYELLLIALNRVTGHPVHASAAPQFDAGRVVVLFPSRAMLGHSCGSCGKKLPATTRCKRCWFRKTVIRHAQAVNADTASASQLRSLVGLLRRDWTNNGDTNSVFGIPTTGQGRDATLDTGHFDNYHPFGWAGQSLANLALVEHTVVDDLLTGQPQRLIPDLELAGQADLNGNGQLDGSTTPGGGASP